MISVKYAKVGIVCLADHLTEAGKARGVDSIQRCMKGLNLNGASSFADGFARPSWHILSALKVTVFDHHLNGHETILFSLLHFFLKMLLCRRLRSFENGAYPRGLGLWLCDACCTILPFHSCRDVPVLLSAQMLGDDSLDSFGVAASRRRGERVLFRPVLDPLLPGTGEG